ncbi:Cyclohexadienyl dehydratase [Colletotrichum tanaceti]|uniref:Cyclohexadienyl dehydratase n=1 Tax=Colletotrichum tanaceti TaxID=1306861 RepID=A0A4U6XNX7_9PEZI|nr:Cyclohexadienyl dehydratase [Colletotrichum tanaceti]TKW57444.1 Cyclohexadienyl dehydratase [Colletotrichum tanaceti]
MSYLKTSALLTALLSVYGAGAHQGGAVMGTSSSVLEPRSSLSYTGIGSLLDTIMARGYLNVGTTGDYKPFTYLVKSDTAGDATEAQATITTYVGADIDAAHSLSAALGLSQPPRLVPTKWANVTSDLVAGKYDIAMGGVSLTLERARTVFFSTAIQRVGKTAAIRCADAGKYKNLASLDKPGVRVAVNPGGTNEAFNRANLKAATVVPIDDKNALYQAVLDNKADAVISDLIEVQLQVKMHQGDICLAELDIPFNFEELGYAMPRDIVWKQFVDNWVDVQLGSGAWNRTLDKWLGYMWPNI